MENGMKKTISLRKQYMALMLAFRFVIPLLSPLSALAAAAPVGYMPGVTEEMTAPAFWSDLAGDPDALLATAEDIARWSGTISYEVLLSRGSRVRVETTGQDV